MRIDKLIFVLLTVHLTDVSIVESPRMDKNKRKAATANIVLSALKKIWEKKSRPMRNDKAMYFLVKSLIERVDFVKVNVRRHENDTAWITDIVEGHDKVFDISEKQRVEVVSTEPMDVDIEPGPTPSDTVENLGKRKRIVPERFRDMDSQVNDSIYQFYV